MFGRSKGPLVPRNGHTLVVVIVARISGCANQVGLSLDDQIDHAKQLVAEMFTGPVDYRILRTTGKGEALDRPELAELEAILRTREADLMIAEDLGRVVRGTAAVELCGIAVDHGTRVLAPNDFIDTAEPWEEDVISACRDHVGHNSHTSKRLKHKLMNRFLKFGGAMPLETYGYIVPLDAKTYADWLRDDAATPFLREGLRMLKATGNCSAVADYFNEMGVPVGPYCRRTSWNGKMVRRLYRNRTLGGLPGRGFRCTVKRHETGRRVSVVNPDGPEYREYPHLAHVDIDELDAVIAQLAEANANRGRKLVSGADPLQRVPRKRTRFPGQWSTCAYCGHQHVWGGNGVSSSLMCANSRQWQCWNSIAFNGALAVKKVVEAITASLYELDGLDTQFRQLVRDAAQNVGVGAAARWGQLERDEAECMRQKQNLQAAVADLGPVPLVREQLEKLQARERQLSSERRQLQALRGRALDLPESVANLRSLLEKVLGTLGGESPEGGALLRKLVPELQVHLVRLCDGGHLLPRARVKLALDGIVPDARHVPGLGGLVMRELTLDLFQPPQRERIRQAAVTLASQGLTAKAIAAALPEKPTATAVLDALALDRAMRQQGLATPYVNVLEPPEDYSKLRRHQNPKYRFKSLEGHVPPAL
ncbi:MAG: hypothetical protein JWN24_1464 [Phycisphaerales bacterium]|nr:hypothetical protein [Phycisphaerales bacterium]